MTAMTTPTDLGVLFAETLKGNILDAMTEFGLTQPATVMTTPGTGIPIHDCCEGLLWVRLDTVYPTLGDGQPIQQARIDFGLPAWVYPIHAGILWCHTNIDVEGYAPDAEYETETAARDGSYRMAIFSAIAERFPQASQPYAQGFRLNPWMPFGPDGGCSGGSVILNVISNHLIAEV